MWRRAPRPVRAAQGRSRLRRSAFEKATAWLAQNGRIAVFLSLESFVRELTARVILRPVTPEIAALSVRLPERFPKDPADRLMAATAMVEAMTLVTADTRIRRSKVVETVW